MNFQKAGALKQCYQGTEDALSQTRVLRMSSLTFHKLFLQSSQLFVLKVSRWIFLTLVWWYVFNEALQISLIFCSLFYANFGQIKF